ncbi:hypothetical protein BUALT_Bualt08G0056100 [Buddleja alternifolia]|uniref:Transposase n=1 Tax=Buddleja alternifolia TaxID=168488 RepID=A0AAV6X4E8_9LAMI|nr:hypothetical protein BUALT_Bualt08G0056100 [Buddleja alternifolia]
MKSKTLGTIDVERMALHVTSSTTGYWGVKNGSFLRDSTAKSRREALFPQQQQGLKDGYFFRSLAKKPVFSFDNLLARAEKYVNMEEAARIKDMLYGQQFPVLDESHLGLNKISGARKNSPSTHDFARYLSEQRLPKRMLHLRDGIEADANSSGNGEQEDGADSGVEECTIHNKTRKKFEDLKSFSFEAGELQIISLVLLPEIPNVEGLHVPLLGVVLRSVMLRSYDHLYFHAGKIAKDIGNFHNQRFIWPEGYTAVSIIDPSVHTLYKMEVLRDADLRTRPLFRVTTDNEEEEMLNSRSSSKSSQLAFSRPSC